MIFCKWFNPFKPNFPFLYSLKISECQSFSGIFRGYRKEHWTNIGWQTKMISVVSGTDELQYLRFRGSLWNILFTGKVIEWLKSFGKFFIIIG